MDRRQKRADDQHKQVDLHVFSRLRRVGLLSVCNARSVHGFNDTRVIKDG